MKEKSTRAAKEAPIKKEKPVYDGHGLQIEFTKQVVSAKGAITEYAHPMTAGGGV